MKAGDPNQRTNQQRSSGSSRGRPRKVEKKGSVLNRLIFVICCAIIGFVGINFVSCNFMIPGSMNQANLNGKLKNPPPLNCKESEKRGYETLLAILTTVIALRTKVEED